jgi:hypothetical protein
MTWGGHCYVSCGVGCDLGTAVCRKDCCNVHGTGLRGLLRACSCGVLSLLGPALLLEETWHSACARGSRYRGK